MSFTLSDKARIALVLPEAERTLKDTGAVAISGCGLAATKVVNLAEVLKRKVQNLHQLTRLREDDQGKWVEVQLSTSQLDCTDPGYQYCG